MPRRNSTQKPRASKRSSTRKVAPVRVIVIDENTPASPHVLNLKRGVEHARDPLAMVKPVTTAPKVKPAVIDPVKLESFREAAQAAPAEEQFTITNKLDRAKAIAESYSQPEVETVVEEISTETEEVVETVQAEELKWSPADAVAEVRKTKERFRAKRVAAVQATYRHIAQTFASLNVLRKEVALGFAVMSLLFTMPIYAFTAYPDLVAKKDAIVDYSNQAVAQLKSSKDPLQAGDLGTGSALLLSALTSFQNAQAEIDSFGATANRLMEYVPVVGPKVRSGQNLLNAGEALTVVGSQLLLAKQNAPETEYSTEALAYWHTNLEAVFPKIQLAHEELENVTIASLPADIQGQVSQLRDGLAAFTHDLELFLANTPSLLDALGHTRTKRYLVVFQNSSELRATGGFIGSFGLVDVDRGELKNLEIPKGGSYDLQGQLDSHTEPPLPLYLVNNRWEFQDSNWYPDFPTSAENLMWFYEHSGGSSVDGVIAITDQFVERLLGAVGSITLADGTALGQETFIAATSEKIASLRDQGSSEPKAILAELAPLLLEKLQSGDLMTSANIAQATSDGLKTGDMMIYSTDPVFADTLSDFGWDGRLTQTDHDYLHVSLSNIGGQKSDKDLEGRIEHQAWIEPDGSIINTVTVIRTHSSETSEDSNLAYARFYVPEGSELIDAAGFTFPAESDFHAPLEYATTNEGLAETVVEQGYHEGSGTRITTEFGKTVFGNWMVTKAHQTSVARVTYKLPFNAFDTGKTHHPLVTAANKLGLHKSAFNYGIVIQRQPGLRNTTVQSHVVVPPSWRTIWMTPTENSEQYSDGVKFEQSFAKDAFFGVTAQRK